LTCSACGTVCDRGRGPQSGDGAAFETLARFEPSAILELTASRTVRAAQQRPFQCRRIRIAAADMIKLPLELVRREQLAGRLRDAIACLNMLQERAEAEQKTSGDYLRPIMLLQAERKDTERETLVPEKVKQALTDDFAIPADQIAIATGATDELEGEDVLLDKTPAQAVHHYDRQTPRGVGLPFATCSARFANEFIDGGGTDTGGAILRMPGAKKKDAAGVKRGICVHHVIGLPGHGGESARGLVKNGFERLKQGDLIHAAEEPDTDDVFTLTSQ